MAAARDLQRAPLLTFTAVIVGLMGLALLAGGAWLAAIGGSLYYVIAGAALLGTAWLLWQRRAAALWLYAALLLGTMIWAISEVGLDFWSLAPRGDVLAPLGVWLLLPFITAHLVGDMRSARWGLVAVLAVALVVLGAALHGDRFGVNGALPQAAEASAGTDTAPAEAKADWTAYGASNFGTRFSSLKQITADNVKNLQLAWEFQTGDHKGPDDPDEFPTR